MMHSRTLENQAQCGPAKRSVPNLELPARYGPWSPGLKPAERAARFRALAALVAVFRGSGCPLVRVLRAAEHAAARSFVLFEELPTLSLRQILSTFAAITRPRW
jgi:hypothetical protein